MKVVILGATGMLGHKLAQGFSARFSVLATVRGPAALHVDRPVFAGTQLVGGVDARDFDSVLRAIEETEPDVVVNCIGIVKQLEAAKHPIPCMELNALFPHRLAQYCRESRIRLIHISTDCVFSGKTGMYTEDDVPDAADLYGRTKLLGEVGSPGCLTLRTSIIGRELRTSNGLVEWLLAQEGGQVRGYRKAVFSGFTTGALATIIGDVISNHTDLDGLWHVASEPITKYELLLLIRDAYDLNVEISPADDPVCDRSLDGSRFQSATGLVVPSWSKMIQEMADDPTPYDQIRDSGSD